MSRQPTIIKARSTSPDGLKARSFVLHDMALEVKATVAEARRQAASILEQARAEADMLREQMQREGRAAGFREGREAGLKEGREQAFREASEEFKSRQASLIAACGGLLEQIERGRNEWLASARQDLVDLAVNIAGRVVRYIGARERKVILANLEEAVQLVGKRSEVSIRINPVDAEAARSFANDLVARQNVMKHATVIEDAGISAGGCVVQWGSGEVDATLETQLQRIADQLGAPVEDGLGGE